MGDRPPSLPSPKGAGRKTFPPWGKLERGYLYLLKDVPE